MHLRYALAGATWSLAVSRAALEVFRLGAQTLAQAKECAGQLYSRDLRGDILSIDIATTIPAVSSHRAGITLNPRTLKEERARLFRDAYHCIGLWHSHPEPMPRPSCRDIEFMRNHSLAARGQLNGVVFVIVGTAKLPGGLAVMVDDGLELRAASLLTAG